VIVKFHFISSDIFLIDIFLFSTYSEAIFKRFIIYVFRRSSVTFNLRFSNLFSVIGKIILFNNLSMDKVNDLYVVNVIIKSFISNVWYL